MLKITPTSPSTGIVKDSVVLTTEKSTAKKPTVKKPKAKKPKAKKPTAKKTKAKARKHKARRGGGKALGDFANTAKVKVLKGKDIARKACFRTGQTVGQNLAAQKKAKYRGRRKYIRKQIALGRISLS